eukprot:47352-Eustigmatos_ZCMA.PRE.1
MGATESSTSYPGSTPNVSELSVSKSSLRDPHALTTSTTPPHITSVMQADDVPSQETGPQAPRLFSSTQRVVFLPSSHPAKTPQDSGSGDRPALNSRDHYL